MIKRSWNHSVSIFMNITKQDIDPCVYGVYSRSAQWAWTVCCSFSIQWWEVVLSVLPQQARGELLFWSQVFPPSLRSTIHYLHIFACFLLREFLYAAQPGRDLGIILAQPLCTGNTQVAPPSLASIYYWALVHSLWRTHPAAVGRVHTHSWCDVNLASTQLLLGVEMNSFSLVLHLACTPTYIQKLIDVRGANSVKPFLYV